MTAFDKRTKEILVLADEAVKKPSNLGAGLPFIYKFLPRCVTPSSSMALVLESYESVHTKREAHSLEPTGPAVVLGYLAVEFLHYLVAQS